MSDDGMMGGSEGPVRDDRPLAVRVKEAYEQGASDIEICEIMGLTMSKFKQTYETNESFRAVVDLGRIVSQSWWMKQGRTNLKNRNFNTPLWALNMKNRFGWAEKSEQVNQDVGNESVEQMADRLQKMLKTIGPRLFPELTNAQVLTMLSPEGSKQ